MLAREQPGDGAFRYGALSGLQPALASVFDVVMVPGVGFDVVMVPGVGFSTSSWRAASVFDVVMARGVGFFDVVMARGVGFSTSSWRAASVFDVVTARTGVPVDTQLAV